MDWEAHAVREERRYADGLSRLPADPDSRQKQLVRIAMAAGGAGLARAMQGGSAAANAWFSRSAECYRESYAGAPPGSWGRLIGAVKARVLAGDWKAAEADAKWARAAVPAGQTSPIAWYAAALAELVRGDDAAAAELADALLGTPEDAFPRPVAESLGALSRRDGRAYADAVRAVLESFETREAYLDDVPVADTVAVLEALADRRGIAAGLESALLPARVG
jgi:hypothetical protein